MTTLFKKSAIPAAVALALVQGAVPVRAGEAIKLEPLKGVSFDAGGKHVLGYFTKAGGTCDVTLLVAEIPASEDGVPAAGARLRVAVEAGKSMRLDTAGGKSLELGCAKGAAAMSVETIDQIAWKPAAKS